MWFNVIGSTTSHEGALITSFRSWYGKAAGSFLTYSLTGRRPYLFPFINSLSSPSHPFCLVKINLNTLPSFRGREYSKTIPKLSCLQIPLYRTNLPALHLLPNDSIGSRSNRGHLGKLEYKYPVHGHFNSYTRCRQLPNFPEAKLSSTFLSPILWKYLKTLQQQPENIQTLFRLQNCLSRKSSSIFRKYSKTFRPATATTSSSNQQQQPGTAINSSNQQQLSTAAIDSSNQQQQSTAATNSSNNQLSSYQQHLHNPRRLPLVITTVPSRGYVLLEFDLGLAAR